jgi:hypothetical protein
VCDLEFGTQYYVKVRLGEVCDFTLSYQHFLEYKLLIGEFFYRIESYFHHLGMVGGDEVGHPFFYFFIIVLHYTHQLSEVAEVVSRIFHWFHRDW